MTTKLDSTFLRRAFTNKKGEVWFEFYKQPCYICGKTGNCIIHQDGKTIACTRVESDKVFSKKNSSYLHFIEDGREISYKKENVNKIREKAASFMLDYAYKNMLNSFDLTSQHLHHLKIERQLSEKTINARMYRSYSTDTISMAKSLLGPLYNQDKFKTATIGFPGSYVNDEGQWDMVKHNGILIPYRNHHNEIVGFQIRNTEVNNYVSADPTYFDRLYVRVKQQPNLVQVAHYGEVIGEFKLELGQKAEFKYENKKTVMELKKGQRYIWLSSPKKNQGTPAATQDSPLPVHVALPTEELIELNEQMANSDSTLVIKRDAVWITEGALKADIAVDHLFQAYEPQVGTTMLAVPGVNTWRSLIPILKNMEVKRVNIAFDMDVAKNEQVATHYIEMVNELGRLGYQVYIALWSSHHKGIDDLVVSRQLPQLIRKF